ncbi:MAG: Competence protein A [Elusimicrobia bacterium ADurb.Bin231]|nr:MAG: Competence protein A [Elusimicrobia bacterium ADurb.Bin231]
MEDGEQKMETLVVATKKEIIQQRIEILVEAGLIPVIIDVDSFAVENAISINLSEEDLRKTFLVVNCGVQTTNIIIIEKGKSRVVRDVFIAGETFTKMLQRNLQTNWTQAEENKIKYGISEPAAPSSEDDVSGPLQQQVASLLSASVKELVSEIQRSIDYYQTQGAASDKHIDRIFLCGGTMLMKGIAGYVESRIKLPVTIFNPFTKIAPGNTPVSDPEFTFAQYAVAVGLATRSKGDTEK